MRILVAAMLVALAGLAVVPSASAALPCTLHSPPPCHVDYARDVAQAGIDYVQTQIDVVVDTVIALYDQAVPVACWNGPAVEPVIQQCW